MKPEIDSREMRFAVEAVEKAVKLAGKVQAEIGQSQLAKSDQSPVTVADFAVQALVGHSLAESFPGDPMVAEEKAEVLRTAEGMPILKKVTEYVRPFIDGTDPDKVCDWIDRGTGKPAERFWTLDPIDGTKGFLRNEQYVVALALIENGKVQISVLGCPHLSDEGLSVSRGMGSLAVAVRGQGAWIRSLTKGSDFKRLHVSGCQDPLAMHMLSSVEMSQINRDKTNHFAQTIAVKTPPSLMDSQAKYVVVASGKADLFFYLLPSKRPSYRMKIWDVAAGALVVEEAGGRTSDLEGKPLDFGAGMTIANNPGILASNGLLHAAALEALEKIAWRNYPAVNISDQKLSSSD